jgi:hypothetical protein
MQSLTLIRVGNVDRAAVLIVARDRPRNRRWINASDQVPRLLRERGAREHGDDAKSRQHQLCIERFHLHLHCGSPAPNKYAKCGTAQEQFCHRNFTIFLLLIIKLTGIFWKVRCCLYCGAISLKTVLQKSDVSTTYCGARRRLLPRYVAFSARSGVKLAVSAECESQYCENRIAGI